jgi:hypothetical protein
MQGDGALALLGPTITAQPQLHVPGGSHDNGACGLVTSDGVSNSSHGARHGRARECAVDTR